MSRIRLLIYATTLLSMALSACHQDEMDEASPRFEQPISNMTDLNIPSGFDFITSAGQELQLTAKLGHGEPVSNARMEVYSWDDDKLGSKLASGMTDASGQVNLSFSLPTFMRQVLVKTNHIGLPAEHLINVGNGRTSYTISTNGATPMAWQQDGKQKRSSQSYKTLGSWNSQGVPNYLISPRDVINSSLLSNINASLPEGYPVPKYNSSYLADGKETSTIINQTADVWVTFVHEGAGYKNVLGFYTYPKGSPPATVSDIKNATLIFPNVSYSGSGGGLRSGDKVKIGRFGPNTAIGWILIANGYNSRSNSVGSGNWTVYSDKNLNPESNASLKQHNVLLYDSQNELLVMGFEDIRRDNGGCDNDFNDAMFYITSNPVTAIDRSNVEEIKSSTDSDNDGAYDYMDDFPNDPNKAFQNFAPAENQYGTLVYEDLWPSKGDYDFNDLVLDYNYEYIAKANGQLSEMTIKAKIRAIGASFKNGFGLEFDISPSKIASISGQELHMGKISRGTEGGNSKASFILFDNAFKIMQHAPGANFVNTERGKPKRTPEEITVVVKFNSGVKLEDLGDAPHNPFIFVNQQRNKEVHLPDQAPTSLASTSMLGQGSDDSKPGSKRYYKTKRNYPWALHTPYSLVYPAEKVDINQGYPYFKNWVQSGGSSNTDWYRDKSGHRITAKLID